MKLKFFKKEKQVVIGIDAISGVTKYDKDQILPFMPESDLRQFVEDSSMNLGRKHLIHFAKEELMRRANIKEQEVSRKQLWYGFAGAVIGGALANIISSLITN